MTRPSGKPEWSIEGAFEQLEKDMGYFEEYPFSPSVRAELVSIVGEKGVHDLSSGMKSFFVRKRFHTANWKEARLAAANIKTGLKSLESGLNRLSPEFLLPSGKYMPGQKIKAEHDVMPVFKRLVDMLTPALTDIRNHKTHKGRREASWQTELGTVAALEAVPKMTVDLHQ